SRPGQLNYFASSGALPYVAAGFLKSQKLDLVQLFYREHNLAMQDYAQGRIDLVVGTMMTILPLVQSGHAKFLAVTNGRRSPMIPDVPTATEAGFPELAFEGLQGLFGPRDISPGLRDRIAGDIAAVAANPAVADRLAAIGQVARGTTPAEFAEMIEAQRATIAAIVKDSGKTPSR